MHLKTKPSCECVGCVYEQGRVGDAWINECAAQHGCCPPDGEKVIFVPDVIANMAEEAVDKLEKWGTVPSVRATMVKAFIEFGKLLLDWTHSTVLPEQNTPVEIKYRSLSPFKRDHFGVAMINNNYVWTHIDGTPIPEDYTVEKWRYIYE